MRGSVRWEIAPVADGDVQSLAKVLSISPIMAGLLWSRGLRDETASRRFLACQLRDLDDPLLIPGIPQAVERTLRALERKERIVLYGDYDVDGVASVAMIQRALQILGVNGVRAFLPDRFDEGYGLTADGVARCLTDGKPDLLIVLDCGTNSKSEVAQLHEQGVDVLILDHHEPSEISAPVALVNYKLRENGGMKGDEGQVGVIEGQPLITPSDPNSLSQITEYCSAGLAFKFLHALLKLARQRGVPQAGEIDLREWLDLVALATVSDIAPLTGENRILTRHGLRQMAQTRWPGLRALMDITGKLTEPTATDCGFKLGPRLNAAGRLESATAALQLLLTDDPDESSRLAQQLNETNRARQDEEARVLVEARADADAQSQDPETRVIVVARPGWHEGVVGIVASRLVREFNLPAFVIALGENGSGKGSGRSIEGFDLAMAIGATRSHLERGGGHAMAAGVSLKVEQIEPWRAALQQHARIGQKLDGDRLRRVIRMDAVVSLSQMTLELVDDLKKLEPCGTGNSRPVFLARRVEVAGDPRRVGADGKHLKLWLRQDGAAIDAIAFGKGSAPVRKGDQLDLVFEVERNDYKGKSQVQLKIRELAASAAAGA